MYPEYFLELRRCIDKGQFGDNFVASFVINYVLRPDRVLRVDHVGTFAAGPLDGFSILF